MSRVIVARISSVRSTNLSPARSECHDTGRESWTTERSRNVAVSAMTRHGARGVDDVAGRRPAGQGDHQPPQGGSDHRGDLPRAGVPGHRREQHLARDDLRQDRPPRRPVERLADPRHHQEQVEQADRPPDRGERRQPCRRGQQDAVGDDHQALAAVPVGQMARRDRQQDHGRDLCKADQAERQRGTRAFVELPADRDVLHLPTDRGRHPREQETPVVAVAEDGVRIVRDRGREARDRWLLVGRTRRDPARARLARIPLRPAPVVIHERPIPLIAPEVT